VFNTKKNNLDNLATINCKNRKGFFSKGRRVVDIKFICNREALVTTADSRIRYIDLKKSEQRFKYKGHTNKTMNIRTSISGDLDLIMSASEDGKIFIWKNMQQEEKEFDTSSKKNNRSDEYETFIASTNKKEASKTPTKKEARSKDSKSA